MSESTRWKTRDRVRKHRALRKIKEDLEKNHEDDGSTGNLERLVTLCYSYEDQQTDAQPSTSTTVAAATINELSQLSSSTGDSQFPVCEAITNVSEETVKQCTGDEFQRRNCQYENDFVAGSVDVIGDDETHQIREWAISRNIKHVDLDHLLRILRKTLIPSLPKTSTTFLQASFTECEIEEMEDAVDETGGQFVYFGVEDSLRRQINTDIHSAIIELQINIDGMQIFKSGGMHFWPILCKVHFTSDIYEPFPVAIYSGATKPADVHEYLAKFIAEINHLQKDGISISGKNFLVSLKCFICDTPARTYIKCTKGHGGYSACERCTCYGTRVRRGRGYTVVYPELDCPRRTDQSFREVKDPDHHIGISPLLEIEPPLNVPNAFVLDYMHLLGVLKKLLVEFWMGTNLKVKLGRRQREELSRRLLLTASVVPCEFQRKTRSIYYVHKWKATEYRFFLLYCGPIVLKNLLPTNLYKHFLLLHVAFRILCSDELALKKVSLAKVYLKRFVQALPYLYGQEAIVINMHNLIHVADDVQNMGCSLSRISCFPFENLLGKLSRSLRTPNLLLSQICRRLQEKKSLPSHKATLPPRLNILNSKVDDGCIRATKLCVNGAMEITTKSPNNLVLMGDGRIVQISKIVGTHSTAEVMVVEGCIWKIRRPVYTYPCHSKMFQAWELAAKPSSNYTRLYRVSDIKTKLVKILFSNRPRARSRVYVMPLLHA